MALLKRGLVSISFRKHPAEKIIQMIKNMPIQGIEWGGDVHVPHGDIGRAKRIGELSRQVGIEVFCYGSYYRFEDVNGKESNDGPSIESVLDTAEALGAERVRLWPGTCDYEDASETYIQKVAERAYEVADLAKNRGISIDLEYHGGTLNNSADNSQNLLDKIAHKNVRTLWQPNVNVSEAERIEELEKLLPRVSNLHCYHWGPKGFGDRRSLEEGREIWNQYISILKKTGQTRWISLEYVKNDSWESLEQDAKTLTEMTELR